MAFFDNRGRIVARTGTEPDDRVDHESAHQREQDHHQPNRVHENIILNLGDGTLGV